MPIIMLPLWGDSNQIDDLDVGIGRYTRFGVRYLVTNGDGRGFASGKGSDGGWLTWRLTATALPMNS